MPTSTTQQRVTAETFFERHYPRLAGCLNALAHASQRARLSPGSAGRQALAETVSLAGDIMNESLAIVGGAGGPAAAEGPAAFLASAGRLREALRHSGEPAWMSAGEAIGTHLDYFHEHVPAAQVSRAIDTEPQSIYLRECVVNCVHVVAAQVLNAYQWSCPDPRRAAGFYDTSAAEAAITPAARTILQDVLSLEGWCSPQKSILLYSLVREHKPSKVVEIGIYGGRSIVPIAAALKDNGAGEVWGIETWSGSAATSYRTGIANDFWWMNIDFTKIKGDFLEFVLRHRLHDTIRVVEAPSDRCGGLFDRIDMLHIDGNHSMYGAAQDVVNFLSKVPSGGIVVYDDINWPSTAAGLDILRDTCRLLHVVTAFGSETEPGCAAFVKV